MCPIRARKIHGRWSETMTLAQLVASLNKDLEPLARHLYTAYHQWGACKLRFASLRPGEVGTQEDYQENQKKEMAVSTTSSHMGPNMEQFALYPIRGKLKTPAGEDKNFGYIFLSSDLLHDKHQVEQIEALLMDLLEQEYGFRPVALYRWSDQCTQQFRVGHAQCTAAHRTAP